MNKTIANGVFNAYDNISVKSCGESTIYAFDKSTIYAGDNSTIYAYDNSIIYAYNKSIIHADGDSTIYAYNNTIVIIDFFSNSQKENIKLFDNAILIDYRAKTVCLSEGWGN